MPTTNRRRLVRFDERGICNITGHCIDVLRGLPESCVQVAVTSPPYWGLRSYGTEPQIWGGSPTCRHEWGEEIIRYGPAQTPGKTSARKGRTNLLAQRQRGVSRGRFCKFKDTCSAWLGELGCEPTAYIYMHNIRRVMTEVYRVLKPDGLLFLNLGDSYHEKELVGIPWMTAILMFGEDNWTLRSECIWYKRNAMPENTPNRPNRDHEHVFMFSKYKSKYYFDMDAVRVPVAATTLERDKYTRITKGKDGQYAVAHNHETPSNPNGRNLRTVWDIPTISCSDAHFAVFPPSLPERCIKMASRPGDIVLDPFGGSGTTAMVAAKLGRRCISIELNPEYMKIQHRRQSRIQKGFFGNYEVE